MSPGTPHFNVVFRKGKSHKNSIIESFVFQGLPEDESGIGVQDR